MDIRIPLLHPGDRVGIAAPARSVSPIELAPALARLTSWGLQVEVPDGLYDTYGQMAGTDTHRASLMQSLLDDPTIRAIFCARGGYGTVRMVDRLDFSCFAKQPKWMIGYSDVTVLHSHIHRHLSLPTLHATMPINFPTDPAEPSPALYSLRQWLFEGRCLITADPHPLSRSGVAEAEVVGGNLSMLYSLCGSPSAIDTCGKILLIEDLDEYLYHIDRMMQNLRRNGMLSQLAGLIVGGLTNMHDNATPFGRTAEQIVSDAVSDYGYPVAFGVSIGHLGQHNLAIPLGVRLRMEVDESKKCRIFAP